MKKLSLALLGGAAVLAAGQASAATCNPTGFFIGINGGVATPQMKLDHEANLAANNFLNTTGSFAGKDADAVFELMVGYNMMYGNFVIGVHVYVGWNDSDGKRTVGSVVVNTPRTFKIERSSNWFWGVGVRLGYLISPRTILSIMLNGEYSKWKVKASQVLAAAPFTTQASKSKSGFNFAPGVELMTFITKQVSVNIRYKCVFGSSITLNIPAAAVAAASVLADTTTKAKVRDHQTTIGISYKVN